MEPRSEHSFSYDSKAAKIVTQGSSHDDAEKGSVQMIEHSEIDDGIQPRHIRRSARTFSNSLEPPFRSLGLSILLQPLRWLGLLEVGEQEKIILNPCRRLAALRAAVHVIPISVALSIVYLNITWKYVGANLRGSASLQFAAKVHELTMVASITSIIFYYIRHQMTLGRGLPLGAAFAGLQVNQLSYLWSLEFWGSLTSKDFAIRKRLELALVVIPALLLAATVGPSSAICMIPRKIDWLAGDTHIWLNGTADEIFPSVLDDSNISESCNSSLLATPSISCPSSWWQAFVAWQPKTTPDGFLIPSRGFLKKMYSYPFPIFSPNTSTLDTKETHFNTRATTQHESINEAFSEVKYTWDGFAYDHPFYQNKVDTVHKVTAPQPYAAMKCAAEIGIEESSMHALAQNYSSYLQELFGTLEDKQSHYPDYDPLTRGELMATPGNASEPRLAFYNLPEARFSNISLGVVILKARHAPNSPQRVLPCIVRAGWINSKYLLSTDVHRSNLESNAFVYPHPDDLPFDNHTTTPLRYARLDKKWAAYANPILPEFNTTAFGLLTTPVLKMNFEAAMDDLGKSWPYKHFATILLVNAMANVNLPTRIMATGDWHNSTWPMKKDDLWIVKPNETDVFLRIQVKSYMQGLSFGLEGPAIKLSITVMLLYSMFALVGLFYSLYRPGPGTEAWDSVTECFALGVNSQPTEDLRNTCAGIRTIGISRLPVKVVPAKGDDGDERSHLEIVFTRNRTMTADSGVELAKAYGGKPDVSSWSASRRRG